MLVLPEDTSGLRDDLQGILVELRRGHVSKFPIHVTTLATVIKFYDSRFLDGDRGDALIAKVQIEADAKGRDVFIVRAETIENDKYRENTDEYHSKQSRDPKKIVRILREHVKPFAATRVARWSRGDFRHSVHEWSNEVRSNYRRTTASIDLEGIVEELVLLRDMGFRPQTEKLAKLMDDAIPAFQEMQRVKNREIMHLHIMINPDRSVNISNDDKVIATADSMDSVHKNIQEHIAMLRMMDNKAFVPEVGMKVNDNQYWVEVSKNTFS
jgi:hypothetical protein